MSAPIGAAMRRKEDQRFLTGRGTYTGDINRPGQLHAVFVEIRSIDTTQAARAPGGAAVFTSRGAVMNAVPDALVPIEIAALDMPAMPEKICRAMTQRPTRLAA